MRAMWMDLVCAPLLKLCYAIDNGVKKIEGWVFKYLITCKKLNCLIPKLF
jgi:hypothetical protein